MLRHNALLLLFFALALLWDDLCMALPPKNPIPSASAPELATAARPVSCLNDGPRPALYECIELEWYLFKEGTDPDKGQLKKYSQDLQDTDTTVHLPKVFKVVDRPGAGKEPNTCAMYLDRSRLMSTPSYDEFTLNQLSKFTKRITDTCILLRNERGWGYPGLFGTVYGVIIRADPTPISSMKLVASFTRGNRTSFVYESISIPSSLQQQYSNLTGIETS